MLLCALSAGMGRLGDYRTSAQKAGRSAGQRRRRMARDRKEKNRAANVYATSVRTKIIEDSRYDNDELAAYGVYNDGDNWILTAMAIQRDIERLVPDRQGATKSEVRDKTVVTPGFNGLDPKDGVKISTFDSKKAALQNINAESSTRVNTGEYVVKASDWPIGMNTHKVDRDRFGEFLRSEATQTVR